ncbi:CBS domain-containing protein, partial [Escherichia sp. TWPC-MK]
ASLRINGSKSFAIRIPRSQMITLKRNQTLDECLDVIIESAHSRFPVISEDKDHIEGILMAKDLLPFMRSDAEAFSMDKVLRQTACSCDLLSKPFL